MADGRVDDMDDWVRTLRVLPFGDRAWLVEPQGMAPAGWAPGVAARAQMRWPGAVLVPGIDSVLLVRSIVWDGPAVPDWPDSADAVICALAAASGAPTMQHQPRRHVLPARYDGPDLRLAAQHAGLTDAELIARHTGADWTVAAVGFSPGFGYLTCPDPVFAAVRRRSEPRRRVPTGAIALAAGMCAVYPSPTPGGWQLVGSTDEVLWSPAADPPALLRVGDRVRFEAT